MKKVLIGLMLLFGGMALCPAQSLDEVVRLAQDSAITAFQNQYEYEYHQQRHAQFEALRKPQLTLDVVPNYLRMVNDLSRYYVYIRNFDSCGGSFLGCLLVSCGLSATETFSRHAADIEHFLNPVLDAPSVPLADFLVREVRRDDR